MAIIGRNHQPDNSSEVPLRSYLSSDIAAHSSFLRRMTHLSSGYFLQIARSAELHSSFAISGGEMSSIHTRFQYKRRTSLNW
jgi:hypothetical protein